jgi:hypothetical protein
MFILQLYLNRTSDYSEFELRGWRLSSDASLLRRSLVLVPQQRASREPDAWREFSQWSGDGPGRLQRMIETGFLSRLAWRFRTATGAALAGHCRAAMTHLGKDAHGLGSLGVRSVLWSLRACAVFGVLALLQTLDSGRYR